MNNLINEQFPHFPKSGLVILIGISGSGKSTWAQEQFVESQILSSDTLRGMLTDDVTNQDCSKDAFEVLKSLVELRLSYGKLSVVDATNLKRPARKTWLELAKLHNVPAVVIYFDVPIQMCLQRQETRDRQVPAEVVQRQAGSLNNIEGNLKTEGWNGILKVTPAQERGSTCVEILQEWNSPRVISEDSTGVRIKHPKLDIIGDVHGCHDELIELLEKMGWFQDENEGWRHPENRFLVFVGDLTDRGPDSLAVLELVARLIESQQALLILGNHDHKLGRWLNGKRVQVKHGLQTTTSEFGQLEPQQLIESRERYLSMLEHAPLWARWYPENQEAEQTAEQLVIAHAAWSPELNGASSARITSYCLYGPNTGEMVDGLPQRLDWKIDYPKNAPFCVVGHTAFDGPVVERNNTMCIDTACVFGGRLTGLKWPSKEVFQVEAKLVYEEKLLNDAPVLVDPSAVQVPVSVPVQLESIESNDEPTRYQMLEVGPKERFDLNIESLFQKLNTSTEDVLGKIHEDEKLLKRGPDGGPCAHLVLANASKVLFTPEQEHQLFAKGLIYTANPWRVVSIPYLKMYNYQERSDVFDLANELAGRDDINVRFNEKLDGTMIQLFSTVGLGLEEDVVMITTRGMIDGWSHQPQGEHANDNMFDYLGETRRILKNQSPAVLDPQKIAGWTLIWEFIHPGSRVVTNYGDRLEVVLTGAVDFRDGPPRYITRTELESLAEQLGAPVAAEIELSGNTLEERIDELAKHLDGTDQEGAVVTFEGKTADGRPAVIHRVKIKGAEYLRLMRLFVNCTYNQTRQYMESDPSLQTWDAFKEHLMKREVPEEVLATYKVHFESWSVYRQGCDSVLGDAQAAYDTYLASNPMPDRESVDDYRIWRRDFAKWVMANANSLSWLFFASADGKLDFKFLNSHLRGCQTALQETTDQWQSLGI